MSDPKHDKFRDVVEAHKGIFEGQIDDHDRVHSTIDQAGALFEFQCNGCENSKQLLLEWPELVALKYGLDPAEVFQNRQLMVAPAQPPSPQNPQGSAARFINPASMIPPGSEAMPWRYNRQEQRWRPFSKCSICQFWLVVRLTADEPERLLAQGRRNSFINEDAEKQVSALCDWMRRAKATAPAPVHGMGMMRR